MSEAERWMQTADEQGQSRALRRPLRLEVHGTSALGTARVLVRNMSSTGLLVESAIDLPVGEIISVDLPQAGPTRAKVVWAGDELFGCQFHTPISNGILSAAQLRSLDPEAEPEVKDSHSARDESFGSRLQRLRKQRGLTLSQIAASLGVSKPTVWAWENGKARPVQSRIDALASALGVPRGELLTGRDPASLEDLLASSRERIALALGTSPDKVRIMVEL